MQRESPTAMDSIIGQMGVILKGLLEMGLGKVTECGKKGLETAINTKASISRIKSMGMAYLLGLVVTFIREIIINSFEITLDRCIGVMVATIRGNG